eukprot:scaffold27458_cov19-Tisochrysis_lutea.AAC.1
MFGVYSNGVPSAGIGLATYMGAEYPGLTVDVAPTLGVRITSSPWVGIFGPLRSGKKLMKIPSYAAHIIHHDISYFVSELLVAGVCVLATELKCTIPLSA